MSKIGLIALATTLMFTGASHAADEIALICSDVNGKDDYSLSIDLDRKLASFHMSDLPDVDGVTSQGELHLDGQVQGDVHCAALVLGENAQLEGYVVAEDVMVLGRLIGSVRVLKVVLQSTAQVEGNLVHKSLAVEHGTHFEGDSRPSENPLASNPEVPGVERQLNHDGHSETVNQHERGNGLIKSLPELLSA